MNCSLSCVSLSFQLVSVQLTILGSGSKGNCAYLETNQTKLLIDAGLSARQIQLRLDALKPGANLLKESEEGGIQGILLTHEHSDHSGAVGILSSKYKIPVFCNRLTHDELTLNIKKKFEHRLFETGSVFEIGDVRIETFSVPHDAQDPVGFVLNIGAIRIGIATDLGHITRLVVERLRNTHLLLLEANHDVQMLQDNPHRPWHLKQRVLSRHGHLSNEATATAVEQLVSPCLQHLVLTHMSQDCNRPDLALSVVRKALEKIGANHVLLTVASQDVASAPIVLDP